MGIAAVIMAGGRGERFWPSSREDRPKQFLSFDGQESLLQKTVSRMAGLCSHQSTWIVTREDYAPFVLGQLPQIPRAQVLLEPEGRDTAACVALATLCIGRTQPDAVMVMLPADHLILREDEFRRILEHAVNLACSGDYLVTLGIRPTRPETAYGYIQVGEQVGFSGSVQASRVGAFKEKPAFDVAVRYLQSGGYLWNSGIFVWRASVIRQALEQYLPDLMAGLLPLEQALGTPEEDAVLRRIYPVLPRLSIDYGVMEKAANTLVIPADFGWDDLGSWAALERVLPQDGNQNTVSGRVLAVETTGSILNSTDDSRLLVAFGLADLVVVDTQDVVLVADKSRVSDMKAVVQLLETEELKRHLRCPSERLVPGPRGQSQPRS